MLFRSKETIEHENDFEHEVAVMLKLRHPNILTLYGIVLKPEFMVIELMEGSLYDVLHSLEILKWPRRYSMALDVARGLAYLHSGATPILHRDLKSLNILLDASYRAKLSDFGLSRVKAVNSSEFEAGKAGTAFWIAPELHLQPGVSFTTFCDVYSLGIVFWEMLTRKTPSSVYIDVTQGSRGYLAEIPSDAPKSFIDIEQRCWAQNSADRPTAQAVCEFMLKHSVETHGERGLSPRSKGRGRFISSSSSSSSSSSAPPSTNSEKSNTGADIIVRGPKFLGQQNSIHKSPPTSQSQSEMLSSEEVKFSGVRSPKQRHQENKAIHTSDGQFSGVSCSAGI